MKEFYLSLLSNSSLDIYPLSKTSKFTVQLPRKIILNENWVVGLSEIHYSYNFFNVSENNNSFTYSNGTYSTTYTIPIGVYNSVSDILNIVLSKTKELGDWLSYDSITNRIRVQRTDAITDPHPHSFDKSNESRSIMFHGRLAIQLGFIPGVDVLSYDWSPYVGNIYFGIPDQMFIYCDLVEPQLIGYESSQVIKIVNTTEKEEKFGSSCFRSFQKIHYIPVMRKEFEKVEIEIKDITGEDFQFRHGVSTIKLHFKEIKNKVE